MHFITAIKFLRSYANLSLSLALGVVAMLVFVVYLPDEFLRMQRSASVIRDWIAAGPWSSRVESILRFVLDENRVLLIIFVLATRLAWELLVVQPIRVFVVLPIKALLRRNQPQGEHPAKRQGDSPAHP